MDTAVTKANLDVCEEEYPKLVSCLTELRNSQATVNYIQAEMENWKQYGNFGAELVEKYTLFVKDFETQLTNMEEFNKYLKDFMDKNRTIQL